MTNLDLEFVRSQFPAFSQENLRGWGFFENAGGSYACAQVIDRLNRYYRETKVQPYGPYPASKRAGEEMDSGRARMAGLLNADVNEISIGPSTSQNSYVIANALRGGLGEGDEIIVTNQDHEANSGVWRRLGVQGVDVREWQVNPVSGELDLADLDKLLSAKTRFVTMPHCSNIVGQINDVTAAAEKVHDSGALLVVDGVSYAPHGFPDLGNLGADIYLFSLYKTFGPHQGVIYARAGIQDQLENQGHYFNADYPEKRLTPAGPDHAQIAATNGVADYYETLYAHHFDGQASLADQAKQMNSLFAAHEKKLTNQLLDFLRSRNDLRILGPVNGERKVSTIAVQPDRSAQEIATALVDKKIMAGSGDFYAVRLLEALNVPLNPGVLRLSFVHYTSQAEIDQLIGALEQTL
ncbi:MAG: aminotransferase class V-fold PLP-dependent enzyme [Rhodospirillaceae bacterium]|nr:aminotransferase class V-fold PLP-dependent enzyme [Rhodospirillaceae bacterium]MBT5245918.1 aminotransferase class V-fold PLP-dependent enzyme [Rhodospirillaceae bacterium]MBT5561843.1 aminotransferase class V-fold PLP-dependent enzyme [Rhodospirillaceae bacterium]MBT6240957.1 aminotransferase class V-fold PLP-dependent enzyme [Rhodospirillaceae bacterium]MBT7138136.1 aminotransferase class V-fold PLP-dependent enzyme [Rhodospirillaceae bacterium]